MFGDGHCKRIKSDFHEQTDNNTVHYKIKIITKTIHKRFDRERKKTWSEINKYTSRGLTQLEAECQSLFRLFWTEKS